MAKRTPLILIWWFAGYGEMRVFKARLGEIFLKYTHFAVAGKSSYEDERRSLRHHHMILRNHHMMISDAEGLGVTFDRTLFFSRHVSSLKATFIPRVKALRCISASLWGPLYGVPLSLPYKAIFWPHLTYALPWLFPFLSVTNFTKLGAPKQLFLSVLQIMTPPP